MNKQIRENIIFIAISVMAFSTGPAIATAQVKEYSPVNFTQELSLSRGSLIPLSRDAIYLTHEDSCKFVQKEFGWRKESCDGIEHLAFGHIPEVDTLIIEKPNSEGYIRFDDWEQKTSKDEIQGIWDEVVLSAREQSKRIGQDIKPIKWYVYPTLDKQKSILYYATLMSWAGEPVINVKATLFDRMGYVTFALVPVSSEVASTELKRLVESTLDSYKPHKQQSYYDFRDGDKVAAVGAVGVLASLLGVKYGKPGTAGLLAILAVLAKKFWFVLLLPLIFLKRLFFGKID